MYNTILNCFKFALRNTTIILVSCSFLSIPQNLFLKELGISKFKNIWVGKMYALWNLIFLANKSEIKKITEGRLEIVQLLPNFNLT